MYKVFLSFGSIADNAVCWWSPISNVQAEIRTPKFHGSEETARTATATPGVCEPVPRKLKKHSISGLRTD